MATELVPKKVVLSQIKEDLESGLTRWKKDDIGFGSLEKKYSLSLVEMVQLLAHPKVKEFETKIPPFIIVDDITDPIESKTEIRETTIEIRTPVINYNKEQEKEKEKEEIYEEAFM